MYEFRFAFATLFPALLLALGAIYGGLWLRAALFAVILAWVFLDWLVPDDGGLEREGTALLATLGVLQLALLPLGVWALATHLAGFDWFVGFLAFGTYLGQIGNPAAHELIHRNARALRRLGTAVYVAMLFGHHASAHRLVHHVHVATPLDPNSARRNRSVWRFLIDAWIGSFRAGLAAERALVARAQGRYRNPYPAYVAGGLALIVLAWATLGAWGLAAYLALALHAQSQLLVSDYVQHYGLRRAARGEGYEPVGPGHSWNARGWYSGALMLNAARHSDHHAHPARPYPALRLPDGAPRLPAPLPAMALVSLFPPLWRRVMHPRLDALAQPGTPSAPDTNVTPA